MTRSFWAMLLGTALICGAAVSLFELGWKGYFVAVLAFLSGRAVETMRR